jgi:predicted transcriptional regulator
VTARERVLRGYGKRCRWCRAPGPLQIDHIFGGGTAHRQALGTRLEYWLCRQRRTTGRWPRGFQLLCTTCHRRKTARERNAMPARKGATALNIALPDHLAAQLAVLAQEPDYHGSKSQVLETALRAFIEGRSNLTVLDDVHQHLATLGAELLQAVDALAQTPVHTQMGGLAQQLAALERRLTTLERQQSQKLDSLARAVDALTRAVTPPKRRLFG